MGRRGILREPSVKPNSLSEYSERPKRQKLQVAKIRLECLRNRKVKNFPLFLPTFHFQTRVYRLSNYKNLPDTRLITFRYSIVSATSSRPSIHSSRSIQLTLLPSSSSLDSISPTLSPVSLSATMPKKSASGEFKLRLPNPDDFSLFLLGHEADDE